MNNLPVLLLCLCVSACFSMKASETALHPSTDWQAGAGDLSVQPLREDTLPGGEADFRLPIRSRASPGVVKSRKLDKAVFSSPVFIIGSDEHSREWLKAHADRLRNMGALGLVAQVQNVQALSQLEAIHGGPLLPVSVDELLSLVGISHYPLVIEGNKVWQ